MKNRTYRLLPKLIIILNAIFIMAMLFFNKGQATTREEPCANAKKISVDALNSVSIKLM